MPSWEPVDPKYPLPPITEEDVLPPPARPRSPAPPPQPAPPADPARRKGGGLLGRISIQGYNPEAELTGTFGVFDAVAAQVASKARTM